MPSVLTTAVSSILSPSAEFFRVLVHLSAFNVAGAIANPSSPAGARGLDALEVQIKGEKRCGEVPEFSGWPEGESAGR